MNFLTAAVRGMKNWLERDCSYCHNIKGRGGKRVGPDMSNVIAKGRTKERLVAYIRDPKEVFSLSIMPKYDLKENELNDLAEFLLALDFKHYPEKVVPREQALAMQAP